MWLDVMQLLGIYSKREENVSELVSITSHSFYFE